MDLFDYTDYKKFLNVVLDDRVSGFGRGARARLSKAVGCQTAYTAQVLRGDAQFSLEQAELINDFFSHSEEEGEYFLLLVQLARAGIPKFKNRVKRQIQKLQRARLDLKGRLQAEEILSHENQSQYYSSWLYSALHALVSIPEYSISPEKMALRLRINQSKLKEILRFLKDAGIINVSNDRYKVGKTRIHLSANSAMITKHHTNWRIQAIKSLDESKNENLHYSSVVSVSETDVIQIHSILIKAIEASKVIIRNSNEEKLYSLSLDFFEV